MWCLLLLYVRIPIQQILHVLLTIGYKFVNDLENLFLLAWLWCRQTIYVTGRSSQIYQHFFGWVRATLYRETLDWIGDVSLKHSVISFILWPAFTTLETKFGNLLLYSIYKLRGQGKSHLKDNFHCFSPLHIKDLFISNLGRRDI